MVNLLLKKISLPFGQGPCPRDMGPSRHPYSAHILIFQPVLDLAYRLLSPGTKSQETWNVRFWSGGGAFVDAKEYWAVEAI